MSLDKNIFLPLNKLIARYQMIAQYSAAADSRRFYDVFTETHKWLNQFAANSPFKIDALRLVTRESARVEKVTFALKSREAEILKLNHQLLDELIDILAPRLNTLINVTGKIKAEIALLEKYKAEQLELMATDKKEFDPAVNQFLAEKSASIMQQIIILKNEVSDFSARFSQMQLSASYYITSKDTSGTFGQVQSQIIAADAWVTRVGKEFRPIAIYQTEVMEHREKRATACQEKAEAESQQFRMDVEQTHRQLLEKYLVYRDKNFRLYDRVFKNSKIKRVRFVNDLIFNLENYAKDATQGRGFEEAACGWGEAV